jgi:hypothetical protein
MFGFSAFEGMLAAPSFSPATFFAGSRVGATLGSSVGFTWLPVLDEAGAEAGSGAPPPPPIAHFPTRAKTASNGTAASK